MDKLAKIETAIETASVRNDLTLTQVGKLFAASGFFQDVKGEAQAITKILAGAENGFGPFASMSGIHIIKGKVELGADLIATGIKKSGKYNFRVKELSAQSCTIEFFERSEFTGGKWESVGFSTFTQDDAKAAGISSEMYKKYGRNMLFARAITNGQAWYCPDVFESRVYSDGELSGEGLPQAPDAPQVPDAPQAPETSQASDAQDVQARLKAGYEKIEALWKEYGINEYEQQASVKKHLHCESLRECTDLQKLLDYYKSHSVQYIFPDKSKADNADRALIIQAFGENSAQVESFDCAVADNDQEQINLLVADAKETL
ncbi:hypothetical protein GF380_04220 [Candidatus Uhrbacteria bacterium]|nr:hypothetical protein [Candidatus Uhrbacteria bacterium]